MTDNISPIKPPDKRPKKGKANYLKPIVIFALFILLAMCIYVIIHLPEMVKDTTHGRPKKGLEQKEEAGEQGLDGSGLKKFKKGTNNLFDKKARYRDVFLKIKVLPGSYKSINS